MRETFSEFFTPGNLGRIVEAFNPATHLFPLNVLTSINFKKLGNGKNITKLFDDVVMDEFASYRRRIFASFNTSHLLSGISQLDGLLRKLFVQSSFGEIRWVLQGFHPFVTGVGQPN